MPAQYYYAIMNKNQNEQFQIKDIESMRNFLIKNPEVNELFHTDLSGLKIECNTRTGRVNLVSREEKHSVKNSFSRRAFEKKIDDVEKAICRFAKHELLHELSKLNDPEITAILKEYRLQFDGASSNGSSEIDKALIKIKNNIVPKKDNIISLSMRFFLINKIKKDLTTPLMQHAIYLAFVEHGIYRYGLDHIKSINYVTTIMMTVKTNMQQKISHELHPQK